MSESAVEHGVQLELPDRDVRERLLDGLGRLVRQRGYETLIRAPILLPTNEHFPDRWQAGPAGVRVLLKRLLAYAGLRHLEVKLHVYREATYAEFDQHGVGHGGEGTAAWFSEIIDGVCVFGVNARELRDVEGLVGTLGHEVAHAYRAYHSLVVPTQETEERLTDLTAVYLGFGVFLLNSSLSFKTGGYSETGQQLLYESRARGYLSPAQIAVLLGAQVAARDMDPGERGEIEAALAPNHAKLARDAWTLLGEDAPSLRERLGIADPALWPPKTNLAELATPIDDREYSDALIEVEPSEATSSAERAFRVVHTQAVLIAVAGAVLSLIVGGSFVEGWALVAVIAVCTALGGLFGASRRVDECSACRARLNRGDARCPRCGAVLAATIKGHEDRLEAEKALDGSEGDERGAEVLSDDSEEPERRLLMTFFAAWAIERGLCSESFRQRNPELLLRVGRGEHFGSDLYEAWMAEPRALSELGDAFAEHYFSGERALFSEDYAILTTATVIRDTRASYARFAALADGRFEQWRASRELDS